MRLLCLLLFSNFLLVVTGFSQTPWPIRTDTVNVFPPLRDLQGVWKWSNGKETLTFYLKTGVITHAGRIQTENLLGNHEFLRDGKRIDPIRPPSPNPTPESRTINIGPAEPNLKTKRFSGSILEESLGKYSSFEIEYDSELKVMHVKITDRDEVIGQKPIEGHVLPLSFELKKIQ